MVDWYAGAEFEVHAYMKSHTGVLLNMVKGEIQKILISRK